MRALPYMPPGWHVPASIDLASCAHSRCISDLNNHQDAGLVSNDTRHVSLPATAIRFCQLVFSEGKLAGTHLDAGAIHAFDEPGSGQGNDPLGLRIAVPIECSRLKHKDRDVFRVCCEPFYPKVLGRRCKGFEFKVLEPAMSLVSDAVGVAPKVPVSGIGGVGLCSVTQRDPPDRAGPC